MKTRRSALKTIAAATAAALPGIAQHQHALIEVTGAYVPKVFSPDQMKTVAALSDLIIPRTETPGASDARIHEFIDRSLSKTPVRRKEFLAGLVQFEGLDENQTSKRLSEIVDTRFFKLLKDLTIDGYYSSKEGLTQELGWNANTFVAEFKGCKHPEHQS